VPNSSKNYYAVLGLAPDAPGTVVRAAYRALAKQYHPDSADPGQAEDAARFIEIQEAYEVLSDPKARREYDKQRAHVDADQFASADRRKKQAHIDPDEVWNEVAAKHPEITSIHNNFCRMSVPLANRFRLAVINNECDDNPKTFADRLERQFLRQYFGRAPRAQALAKRLLAAGHRDAARELNKALKGENLSTKRDRDKYLAELERTHFPDTQSETTKAKRKPASPSDSTKSRGKHVTWGIAAVAMALVIVGGVGLSVALVHVFSSRQLDPYSIAKASYDRLVSLGQLADRSDRLQSNPGGKEFPHKKKLIYDRLQSAPGKSDGIYFFGSEKTKKKYTLPLLNGGEYPDSDLLFPETFSTSDPVPTRSHKADRLPHNF
jgi:curved DNA-binding protein CbpA